ncbi:hypothetical protein RJ640_021076 [Escallonia rubra]|uniref:Uncharacterized protein n=1 Tax=Escallonia rubra TaxID=112253 RepID=A0AA88UB82_9ASTE|nr:hypothetical protein RJ640_021076 [Escallonia rubra]
MGGWWTRGVGRERVREIGVEEEEFEEDGLEGGVCSSVREIHTHIRTRSSVTRMASSKNKGKVTSKDKENRRVWTTIEEQTFLDIMEECVKEGRKQES